MSVACIKWFFGGLFWAIFQLDQFDSTLQMTFDEKNSQNFQISRNFLMNFHISIMGSSKYQEHRRTLKLFSLKSYVIYSQIWLI
jgi:hypothetical protein